ncbi:hypothetical protein [Brevibacterium sp. S111]|uniref:MmyB family transcriptional regulator n=1 Tax=Brevibacterium sp. S111 TaxID=2483795 RepID=UPI00108227CF|nr:hypothetical protein [Brevibacterium sp. S111]
MSSSCLSWPCLRNLLDAHEPNPALLLDDHWEVVDANRPVDVLLAGCHPDMLTPPINVIRWTLHPREPHRECETWPHGVSICCTCLSGALFAQAAIPGYASCLQTSSSTQEMGAQ